MNCIYRHLKLSVASSLSFLELLISMLLYVVVNGNSLSQDTHDTSLLSYLKSWLFGIFSMLKCSFFCTFFSIVRQLFKKMQHSVRSNMVRLFFIIWFCLVKNYLSFSLLWLLSFCSWFLLRFLQWHDALLQKQEDNELVNLKPLPTAKPVNLPDGITAELYGDIAMLTEFVYTFQDLLLPKEKLYISTGTNCFHLFFFVVVCLVKIIVLFFLL